MRSRMTLPKHSEYLCQASSCRVMMPLLVSAAFVCAGCASSQGYEGSHPTREPSHDGRLSGEVSVCSLELQKCVPTAGTVVILSVHGTEMGGSVAKQHTSTGRFSFVLPPGKYFPSASDVQPRLSRGRCIAGYAVVRARDNIIDGVLCFPRVR
jgi:hypothetical protein